MVRTRTSPRKSGSNLVSFQEGVSGLPPLAAIKEEDVSPDEVGSMAVVGSTAEAAIEIDMDEDENTYLRLTTMLPRLSRILATFMAEESRSFVTCKALSIARRSSFDLLTQLFTSLTSSKRTSVASTAELIEARKESKNSLQVMTVIVSAT